MYDILIIGAGPAGISAGLYAKRAGNSVLILYHGESNLEKAFRVDNYYGFKDGIDGKTLYENGIKQAENMGIEIKNEEALHIEKNKEEFVVKTENEIYKSKSIIIATGNKKLKPNIQGIEKFEGKGISYCAVCDGFFFKNKNVAVIGNRKFAINEAEYLKHIVKNVTILTNGEELKEKTDLEINTKKIKEIHGDTKIDFIEFEDETKINVDGIFIALGEASGIDFAKTLGIIVQNDNIMVDENMKTNIDGIYSCGNATGGLLQICKAVYEGAKAGLSASSTIGK